MKDINSVYTHRRDPASYNGRRIAVTAEIQMFDEEGEDAGYRDPFSGEWIYDGKIPFFKGQEDGFKFHIDTASFEDDYADPYGSVELTVWGTLQIKGKGADFIVDGFTNEQLKTADFPEGYEMVGR